MIKSIKEISETVQRKLDDTKETYPEVFRAVQTRKAAQMVMLSTEHNMKELLEEGLLEAGELKRISGVLEDRMFELVHTKAIATHLVEGYAWLCWRASRRAEG